MTEKEVIIKDVEEDISSIEWTRANTAFVIESSLELLPQISKYLLSLPKTKILYQRSSLGFLRIVEGRK